MMDGWNMSGWGWGWMSLSMIVGLVVIALVARTVLRDSGSRTGRTEEEPALETLSRRFAAGEIDEEEFNRKRAALAGRI